MSDTPSRERLAGMLQVIAEAAAPDMKATAWAFDLVDMLDQRYQRVNAPAPAAPADAPEREGRWVDVWNREQNAPAEVLRFDVARAIQEERESQLFDIDIPPSHHDYMIADEIIALVRQHDAARPALTPEQQAAFDEAATRWRERYREQIEALRETQRITAEDLAITITSPEPKATP